MLSIELNPSFKEELNLKWATKILWEISEQFVQDVSMPSIAKAVAEVTGCSAQEAFDAVDAHANEVFK
mgnify:CR=1 FL=1